MKIVGEPRTDKGSGQATADALSIDKIKRVDNDGEEIRFCHWVSGF